MFRILAVVGLLIGLGGPKASAEVHTFNCLFTHYSSVDGLHEAEKNFSMRFQIDSITRESFMIGNAGLAAVENHSGNNGLTFLEKLITGAVQTTTISRNGQAVHSRHSLIMSDLVPTQYYGTCKV